MTIWTRPSGSKIETKDTPEMISYAEKAGWIHEVKEAATNDNSTTGSKRSGGKNQRKGG